MPSTPQHEVPTSAPNAYENLADRSSSRARFHTPFLGRMQFNVQTQQTIPVLRIYFEGRKSRRLCSYNAAPEALGRAARSARSCL